jgi:hypothetical protein
MATEQDKRCGTCRHHWIAHEGKDRLGFCLWAKSQQFPEWMREAGTFLRDEANGADCPTWAAKDEKA